MYSLTWLRSLIFCILALLCTLGLNTDISQQADSEGYLSFAAQILSGQILDFDTIDWPTVIRTPGYPLLLAFNQLIFGSDVDAVVYLHFVLGLAALYFFVYRFSSLIGLRAAVILGFLAQFLWREYYSVVLTEWSAFCLLIIFISYLPLNFAEFSPRRLLFLCLWASLLTLIRPALICILPVIVLMLLLVVERVNLRLAFAIFLTGICPIFLWSVFNLYRLGTFNIAAFAGHNLLGNASLVGSSQIDEKMNPRLWRFADFVDSNKMPKKGEEIEILSELSNNYQALSKLHNHNVYQVALNFDKEDQLSRVEYDFLMKSYAWNVIIHNPRAYLSLVVTGLAVAKRDLWLIIVAILCLTLMIKTGHQLSLVLGVALATHISHLLLISFFQIVLERYYLLTFIPLGLFTVVSIISAIRRVNKEDI